VVANGNVKVQLEDKLAETQEAVYTTSDRILILTGEDSKLISGQDSITGSKITFYRDSGRVKVESSGKKSVEAVVFSGEKGLN
jgi:lipopolysaccharide export system protein LptA